MVCSGDSKKKSKSKTANPSKASKKNSKSTKTKQNKRTPAGSIESNKRVQPVKRVRDRVMDESAPAVSAETPTAGQKRARLGAASESCAASDIVQIKAVDLVVDLTMTVLGTHTM